MAIVVGFSAATVGLVQANRAKRAFREQRDAAEAALSTAEEAQKREQEHREAAEASAAQALREAARDAINRIHARLVGAEHGQLSLARTAEVEGALSQADEPGQGGELSRVTDEQS